MYLRSYFGLLLLTGKRYWSRGRRRNSGLCSSDFSLLFIQNTSAKINWFNPVANLRSGITKADSNYHFASAITCPYAGKVLLQRKSQVSVTRSLSCGREIGRAHV